VHYLTFEQIVRLNKRLIARYGGFGPALPNPGPLVYVLEAIAGAIFGVERYPSLEEKACAVAYTIMRFHVFVDGNKKTGLEVLFQMLELNGRTLLASDNELVEMAETCASGHIELEDLVHWVRQRLA